MGFLNHKKKPPIDEAAERVQHFFDDYFREELRKRGSLYFEKIIDENAALFKKDLDATIAQVYTELKTHLTIELDEQFIEYSRGMKDTQDTALQQINRTSKELEQQHQELGEKLQKSVNDQDAMLNKVFEESTARLAAMQEAQSAALETLNSSVQALQEQHQQLATLMQKSVVDQKAMLTKVFEENMAQIIEHYLLGALGDQYDLKAQLPSIIKQMEANKQAIVDDMKL